MAKQNATAPAAETAPAKSDALVVVSKVKDYIKTKDMMCSAELIESLTQAIAAALDRAVERAAGNGRKTVKASDL